MKDNLLKSLINIKKLQQALIDAQEINKHFKNITFSTRFFLENGKIYASNRFFGEEVEVRSLDSFKYTDIRDLSYLLDKNESQTAYYINFVEKELDFYDRIPVTSDSIEVSNEDIVDPDFCILQIGSQENKSKGDWYDCLNFSISAKSINLEFFGNFEKHLKSDQSIQIIVDEVKQFFRKGETTCD